LRELVVVKLGGSLITDKRRPFTIKRETLERVAGELREAYGERKLVIVHGGGSYGHPVAKEYGIGGGLKSREQLTGFGEVRYWMTVLNSCVVRSLLDKGLPAVPLQASAFIIAENGAIRELFDAPLREMIGLDLVPVTHGDAVLDTGQGFSIVSGDLIAAEIAVKFDAERLVYALDVDGVYTSDPRRDPHAVMLREITEETAEKIASGTAGIDVTGGISYKVKCALIAARRGIEVLIGSGEKRGNLKAMILGREYLATKIVSHSNLKP